MDGSVLARDCDILEGCLENVPYMHFNSGYQLLIKLLSYRVSTFQRLPL